MARGDTWLENLAEQMNSAVEGGVAPNPEELTVREFLNRFGFLKRTSRQVAHIRDRLQKYGLRTNPDFVGIWIDHVTKVELVDGVHVPEEPTVRIGQLEAAHQQEEDLVWVKREERVSVATAKMLLNDFSQLPVMQNRHSTDVKWVISWRSIGSKYALCEEKPEEEKLKKEKPKFVKDCMEPAKVVETDSPLLTVVEDIYEYGYVLVRDNKNEITGIVTASDVAHQFKRLTGPFLLIGEIEGHLRNLILGRFTLEEITDAAKVAGSNRPVRSAEDLTLGGYCVLLGKQSRWDELRLNIERKVFIKRLEEVRDIRNDVMHFNTDGPEEGPVEKLEDVANFFRYLKDMKMV